MFIKDLNNPPRVHYALIIKTSQDLKAHLWIHSIVNYLDITLKIINCTLCFEGRINYIVESLKLPVTFFFLLP